MPLLKRILSFRFRGIGTRIIGYTLVFALAISVSLSSFQLWQARQNETMRVTQFLDQLAISSEATLADVVWEEDRKNAEQIAENILKSTDVTYFLIKARDTTLVKLGSTPPGMIQRTVSLNTRRGDRLQEPFGSFTVGVNMSKIYDRLNAESGGVLLRTGLLIFLIIGFELLLFQLMVTRHLGHIGRFFATLTMDSLDRFLILNRKPAQPGEEDEFDDLVAGVTQMQTTLARDIRRREQAEAEVRLLNEALEERVAQRTAELEKSLSDLRLAQVQLVHSEKMASLGQLVANVAHEINTPIGAIKSSGKSIADSLDETLDSLPKLLLMLEPDDRARFLRLIHGAKSHTTTLSTREERAAIRELSQKLAEVGIDNAKYKAATLVQLGAQTSFADCLPLMKHPQSDFILSTAQSLATMISGTGNINVAVDRISKIIFALKSFSRVNAKGEMIVADLREGMETVLTIYQSQIRQGTELVKQFDDLPPLHCLPDELNQVWTNLIHNALQAMKQLGTLTVVIRQEGDDAVVEITDTGCGIPAEIRDRIFDPFFTTKAAGEGSGLGLDIVRKIVDKHNGRIEVKSEVGVGTTFRVSLPYTKA